MVVRPRACLTSVAILATLAYLSLLMLLEGCDYDPHDSYYTGEAAQKRLLGLPSYHVDKFPSSAINFKYYDGGNFNGLNDYLTFTCGSVDDCYKAIEVMGGPRRAEFIPWRPSRLGVIMDGPSYSIKRFDPAFWPIRSIIHGVQDEKIYGNRGLTYYAIDLDRRTVFYQRSSGGFDDAPPKGQ